MSVISCLLPAALILAVAPVLYGQLPEALPAAQGVEPEGAPIGAVLDIILALDNSGSMKANDPEFLTKRVAANFLDSLSPGSRLGLVVFDEAARLVIPLTEVAAGQVEDEFVEGLSQVDYRGRYTNSPAGIERAIYELKSNARPGATKLVIFLTDGIVDTGDKTRDQELETWLKQDLAADAARHEVLIFGVAFTDAADFSLIQSLASKTNGEYFRALQASDIDGVFQRIDEVIKQRQEAAAAAAAVNVPVQDMVPAVERRKLRPELIAALALAVGGLLYASLRRRKASGTLVGQPGSAERQPTQGPALPPMPRAELRDLKKAVLDKPLAIGKTTLAIGREGYNDLVIANETVSADHAVIEFKEGDFYIEDLRSSNGTSLNGTKLVPNQPKRLKNGDRIQFDVYEFVFVLPERVPVGGTRLATDGLPGRGTVLRPSEAAQERAPIPPRAPAAVEPRQSSEEARVEPNPKEAAEKPAPAAPPSLPAVQPPSGETRLKPGMCPKHAARRASELCSVCKNAFCTQCVTDKDGKTICLTCAERAGTA